MPTWVKAHIANAWQALLAVGDLPTVTYHHKSGPTASVVTSSVTLYLHAYSKREIDNEVILRTDLRGFLPADDLTFVPTQYDEFVRTDGTRWRVMAPSGESGQAMRVFQCRQVAA